MSQSAALTNARISYAASVIAGVTYGAYAVLAAICMHFLLKRRSRTLSHRIILAYTVLMLAVTTVYYAMVLSVLKNTAYVFNIFLADSLLIYRLFIVWGGFLPAIVLPSVVWCGTIATGIGLLWSSSRPSASLVESEIIHWQTSFYSCTVSHNIMCTILIAGRLWYYYRKARKIRLSEYTPYSSVIAIIVESAALYSLCGIVYIPLVVRMLPAQFAVTALIGSLMAITPNLIILQMALGTSVSSPAEMSSMAFKLSTLAVKQADGRSQGTTTANHSFGTLRTSIPLSGGDGIWPSDKQSAVVPSVVDKDSFV